MQAIIQACRDGCLQGLVEPVLVIASRADAGGIQKALNNGIKERDIVIISPRNYRTEADPQQAFGGRLLDEFDRQKVDLFGQYGWLSLTPPCVIEAVDGINQHPGPLDPGYDDFGGAGMYGRRVHAARLYYVRHTERPGQSWTEATAHRVTTEYDKGEVVGTRRIAIEPSDDVATLQEKVLSHEHALQIEILRLYAEGALQTIIRDERVVLPEERSLLHEAKRVAGIMWPKG